MNMEYLDKNGLSHFNDSVNARLQNRVKYKGEFALSSTQTNWDALAPTHIGDTYLLKAGNVSKVEIGGITFSAGEWILVTNETRLNGVAVVDLDGAPAHVTTIKFGGSSLPDATNDGDALVFVDGDWKILPNYAYSKVVDGETVYYPFDKNYVDPAIVQYAEDTLPTDFEDDTLYLLKTTAGTPASSTIKYDLSPYAVSAGCSVTVNGIEDADGILFSWDMLTQITEDMRNTYLILKSTGKVVEYTCDGATAFCYDDGVLAPVIKYTLQVHNNGQWHIIWDSLSQQKFVRIGRAFINELDLFD